MTILYYKQCHRNGGHHHCHQPHHRHPADNQANRHHTSQHAPPPTTTTPRQPELLIEVNAPNPHEDQLLPALANADPGHAGLEQEHQEEVGGGRQQAQDNSQTNPPTVEHGAVPEIVSEAGVVVQDGAAYDTAMMPEEPHTASES